MIDTKELRRLVQAATPGPRVSQGRYIDTPRHTSYIGEVRDQCGNWSDTEKSRSDAAYIAAANPATISELLDRLEAAEKEIASWKGLAKQFGNEADALRAEVERMERDLRLIAETDPVDAALDPQRAVRIAHAALEELK